MEHFLRATALVLLAVVLSLVLSKQSRDLSLLLSLAVCCMICTVAVVFLQPVMDFLEQLRSLAGLDSAFLAILLKCAGIGFLSEIASLICADAGESALGKALQILSGAAILYLSLPLLRQLLDILQEVLGQV